MVKKCINSGIEIKPTMRGWLKITSPFREKSIMIVASNAIAAMFPMTGRNSSLNHFSPFHFMSALLDVCPVARV